MPRFFMHLSHRYLVRAPVPFGFFTVNFFGARPTLWGAENDHGPEWSLRASFFSCIRLNGLDFFGHDVERISHELMHLHGIISLDEMRRIPIPAEQVIQLFVADSGEDTGISDLVAVEMENR